MTIQTVSGTLTAGDLSFFTTVTVGNVDVLSALRIPSPGRWALEFDDDAFPDEYELIMVATRANGDTVERSRMYQKNGINTLVEASDTSPMVSNTRFTITSHAVGDTLMTGDVLTVIDNGVKSNPNDTVDIHIFDSSGTRFDQGISLPVGDHPLTHVPFGPIEVRVIEIFRNDANTVIGTGDDNSRFNFVGETNTGIDRTGMTLDVTASQNSFTVKDSSGNVVSEILPGGNTYTIEIDWVDTDGVYAGANPVQPLDVNLGSEVFSSSTPPTNFYTYTSPSFQATAGDATFTWGKPDANGDIILATKAFPVAASTATQPGDLTALGAKNVVFPFAEGWGVDVNQATTATSIEVVTNKNDSGAGSLREALLKTTPRRIYFDISQELEIDSRIFMNSSHGNVAIFGQTSRGNGFELRMREGSKDTCITIDDVQHLLQQHMKYRTGPSSVDNSNQNNFDVIGNSRYIHHDHVTAMWATDQQAAIYGDVEDHVTSNCIFAEGMRWSTHTEGGNHQQHSTGYIGGSSGSGLKRHSIINTLFAINNSRNPLYECDELQMVNCLAYITNNFGMHFRTEVLSQMRMNVENCQIIAKNNHTPLQYARLSPASGDTMRVYSKDNFSPVRTSSGQAQSAFWDSQSGSITHENTPFLMPSVNKIIQSNLEQFIIDNAGGLNNRRDATDDRLLNHLTNRDGTIPSKVDNRVATAENSGQLSVPRLALVDGPSRLDLSRNDKIGSWFRSKYAMGDNVSGLTETPAGSEWTWNEHFEYECAKLTGTGFD